MLDPCNLVNHMFCCFQFSLSGVVVLMIRPCPIMCGAFIPWTKCHADLARGVMVRRVFLFVLSRFRRFFFFFASLLSENASHVALRSLVQKHSFNDNALLTTPVRYFCPVFLKSCLCSLVVRKEKRSNSRYSGVCFASFASTDA